MSFHAQCTVFYLTPLLRLGISRAVSFNIAACSIKMAWKYIKVVNDYIQQHSAVLSSNLGKYSTPIGEWIDVSKSTKMVKTYSLRGIYNGIVYKFDLNVSRRTDRWRKSRWHNNKPTPCIRFPKHRIFRFPPPPPPPQSRASIHSAVIRLTVRSREISKSRDWML